MTVRLPSSWWPASDDASDETPSMMSPSEASTQMWWSKGLSPGFASGSSIPLWRRWAKAMPTADAKPDPSGPVVISTPLVWWTSGWPGVCEPHVRNALRSPSSRP
jgi:hypothetical protein